VTAMSSAPQAPEFPVAAPKKFKPPRTPMLPRWLTMARTAVRMMVHDRLKMLGTLFGVVFAVILCLQQLGVMFGLIHRNTMLVVESGADIWLVPPSTEALQPGKPLTDSVLLAARVHPDVLIAEPLIYGAGTVSLPTGGAEAVTLIGTRWPYRLGGPWTMVAGDRMALAEPDTLIFEDSKREQFGGLNMNSLRELNGRQIRVGGFTWGAIAFAAPYTFADFELARELTRTPAAQMSFVLIKLRPGADATRVAAELDAQLPEIDALTRQQFSGKITKNLLAGPIGGSFGISTFFGLVIGFFIVALLMFSSVLDNLREFGTLKAIGCTNRDLTRLILTQSILYALIGSFIGLSLITTLAQKISSAQFFMIVPMPLVFIVPAVMLAMCLTASTLALLRIRSLEPAMVFR
jgi:putative ABC transport system permease protein